jgi:hypothetical protein
MLQGVDTDGDLGLGWDGATDSELNPMEPRLREQMAAEGMEDKIEVRSSPAGWAHCVPAVLPLSLRLRLQRRSAVLVAHGPALRPLLARPAPAQNEAFYDSVLGSGLINPFTGGTPHRRRRLAAPSSRDAHAARPRPSCIPSDSSAPGALYRPPWPLPARPPKPCPALPWPGLDMKTYLQRREFQHNQAVEAFRESAAGQKLMREAAASRKVRAAPRRPSPSPQSTGPR